MIGRGRIGKKKGGEGGGGAARAVVGIGECVRVPGLSS